MKFLNFYFLKKEIFCRTIIFIKGGKFILEMDEIIFIAEGYFVKSKDFHSHSLKQLNRSKLLKIVKKEKPLPIGTPTQIRGIREETILENIEDVINREYKNLGINAYSKGIATIDGFSTNIFQFYKI